MNTWYIYKITNQLTNKSYVGQRKTNILPLKDTKYMGSGTYLINSQRKYGLEHFTKVILKDNIHCQTAANVFERIFIKKEGTFPPPNGYNLKSHSMQNCVLSEETLKKMSEVHKNISDETRLKMSKSQTGKKLSEEQKRKIRETSKKDLSRAAKVKEARLKIGTWKMKLTEETKKKISEAKKGEKNPLYGTKHTEEWKRMMSKKHKGKPWTEARRQAQINKNL